IRAERSGKLAGAGRVAEPRIELLANLPDLGADALQLARDAQRARSIAEMAPDLALDHCRGERGEGDAAVGVEATCGLDESDCSYLSEILEFFATAEVPARNGPDERQVGLDQMLAPFARRRLTRRDHVPTIAGFSWFAGAISGPEHD